MSSSSSSSAALHAAKRAMEKQRAREAETQNLLAENSQYGLVLDDDPPPPPPSSSSSKPPKRKKPSIRTNSSRHSDSDTDDRPTQVIKRRRDRSPTPPPAGDHTNDNHLDPEARRRAQDLADRDAFAERLKQKDAERERKLIEDRSRLADSAAARRRALADDSAARSQALPTLRERSRQEYLEKREEQQLAIMKRQLEEERALFRNQKLTKKEQKDFEYREKLVRIAEERRRIEQESRVQAYAMPEDYYAGDGSGGKKKREEALYARYKEDPKEQQYVGEQDEWERHQLKAAMAAGKDLADEQAGGGEFDFVFDEEEHIDFVLSNTMNEDAKGQEVPVIDPAVAKAMSIQQVRQSLPVFQYRQLLLDALQEHQIIIIVGETGSGKTTQLPQYLHEAGFTKDGKKIGCTQPRRVAAMSVAARVAEEMNVKLGYEVGYSIRFEDCTSDKTVIKYMTDGMLLREFMTEPDLASYACLMIDEAHERTLHTDVLLGLIKDIARFRPDLKLLISSATMDAQKFSDYFDFAPILYVEGRKFPVDIYYTKAPEADYLQACVATVMQIHITQGPGDILLYALGALNDQGQLTKLGRRMAEFPSDPMLSRTLLAAEKYNCAEEVVSIVAMLSVQNSIFYKPKDKAVHADKARQSFFHASGDHLTLLNVWNQWVETNFSVQWCYDNFIQHRSMTRAHDVRDQLVGLMERVEVPMSAADDPFGDPKPILKAFAAGFFYHACRINKAGDSYRNIKHNNSVMIHPTSALYKAAERNAKGPPKWVMYHELVFTTKEFMRQAKELEDEGGKRKGMPKSRS
ncbi:P-loop containing nucleoside triphosphate hydrolase protein [Catenaria anguillulae PL171]|uniref:RNA helicase n=1 Tax=Catenaria anguillulae PL171 TaxID=765915 RepID=A0A1Y2HHR6_9FUNG|nr:P-loop containing nucleoside triphosphate hydrolase protein [Catenaria anguillulae PL171]